MGFRTVVVKSRCKLEHRLNYLVIRGEDERRIFLSEINVLIVQSTAVSLTAALLSELVKNNVKVIFCDEKFNPHSELAPYYGAHNTSKRYKMQALWQKEVKDEIWRIIITRKILNQSEVLYKNGFCEEAELLKTYAAEVVPADVTNREGHAAKVYFNRILPNGCSRKDNVFLNGCLNYGYAVLLSLFNREITASGYLTQFGIWHDNEFNQFNLSSDLMEPLRPFIDEIALKVDDGDKDFKRKMAEILNYKAESGGKSTTFDIAVRQYVKSFFCAIECKDFSFITFPQNVTPAVEQSQTKADE